MNKKLVFSIISIFILIIIIAVFFFILKPRLIGNVLLTGQITKNNQINQEYSYTKAICNESNFCQDYEITCKNKTLVSSSPITGAIVQHDESWRDPRNQKDLCE